MYAKRNMAVEREMYQRPTQKQLDILHKEPDAHAVFETLSRPVQMYLNLNWMTRSPTLTKEQRKEIRERVCEMAIELFGEQNKDKPYNREMKQWSDALTKEIWGTEGGGDLDVQ